MSALRLTPQDLSEAFKLFDADGSGAISEEELRFALQSLGMHDVTKKDIDQIMDAVDKDGSRTIDEDEFIKVVQDRCTSQGSEAEIKRAFQLFDEDGTQYISLNNLREISRSVEGRAADDKFLKQILAAASTRNDKDPTGNPIIRFDEFKTAVTKYERPTQVEVAKLQRRQQRRQSQAADF
eukprot:TRINITY_DN166_c0_g4_i1.p3 TRINITY_DN166_c0_g4~~TRINITY_DN166_c0_g4_i1.p3  ORF type:complete len:209 (+),score=109.84 TRINITY_DN166_c0_g4_i1:87-629(+)